MRKRIRLCPHCPDQMPEDECFAHCHKNADGEHQPDLALMQVPSDVSGIVDVTCKLCGVSGSAQITPDMVMWE